MRKYALTYPQLILQAVDAGLPEPELARLRLAYDLAVRLVDGLYRKQGVPFLCHLVRTASIVLHDTRDLDTVLAGLLHAVHFLHLFEGSRRRGPRASDRRFLREQVGEPVDRLISQYSEFKWNAKVALRHQDPSLITDPLTRRILSIKLADELEDHLDAAEAFVPKGNFRPQADYGTEFIGLATALNLHALATDFREAVDQSLRARLPDSVLSPHRSSHEVRNRLWMASPIERLGSHLRRRGVTGGGSNG